MTTDNDQWTASQAPDHAPDLLDGNRLIETERCVLAATLRSVEEAELVFERLVTRDFTGVRVDLCRALRAMGPARICDPDSPVTIRTHLRESQFSNAVLLELDEIERLTAITAGLPERIASVQRAAFRRQEDFALERLIASPDPHIRGRWLDELVRIRGAVADVRAAEPPKRKSVTAAALVADYRAGRLKDRPVLIDGLLREGDVLIVFGPAGMGKTQFSLALGVALATGGLVCPHVIPDRWFPMFAVRREAPTDVLVVAAEEASKADPAKRLSEFAEASRIDVAEMEHMSLYLPDADAVQLHVPRNLRALESEIRATNAKVLILDNLLDLAAGIEKSDETAASEWFRTVVRHLKERHDLTIILLAHANKGTAEGDARSALDRLFGSMAWGGRANGAVMLDWHPNHPTERRLICAKSRSFAPFETTILSAPPGNCVFTVKGPAEGADAPSSGPRPKYSDEDLVVALQPAGEWHLRTMIATALGVQDGTLKDHLGSTAPSGLRARMKGRIEVGKEDGPQGRARLRLVPLEELAIRQSGSSPQ